MGLTRFLVAVLGLLAAGAACLGQAEPVGTPDSGITMRVESFGVGGHVRPGSWAGLKLRIEYDGDQPTPVIVTWQIPDADGDTVIVRRDVTLNPGGARASTVWLYARLSPRFDVSTRTYVEVFEQLEPPSGSRETRRGRALAIMPVTPMNVESFHADIIGVLGTSYFGLFNYKTSVDLDVSPTGHTVTQLVGALRPGDLPDRWMGLAAMSVLVWGPGSDLSPTRLSEDQAAAVKEMVRRGGHLVIILPRVPDIWMAGPDENPLADLFPPRDQVHLRRLDDASLVPLRRLLTNDTNAAIPSQPVALHTFQGPAFESPGVLPETVPIMVDQDGRPIVITRTYGMGMVTIIGIDLSDSAIRTFGLPEADRFWNRVLGRRADAISVTEHDRLVDLPDITFSRSPTIEPLDDNVSSTISLIGSAARGLLLAVLAFAAYWVIAGPGLWGMLRAKKLSHHAWVGFVAAAALFTAISWIGATLIKPRNVPLAHVTFLDAVAGQQMQRTTTFFGVLLPDYGSAEMRVGEEDDLGAHNTLWSFEDPTKLGQPFPDARAYEIRAALPNAAAVPTRATAKRMIADWIGHVAQPWELPYADETITVVQAEDGVRSHLLEGVLTHNLPATPDRVTILYIQRPAAYGQRDRSKPPTRTPPPIAIGWTWTIPGADPWEPGDKLNLAEITDASRLGSDASLESYLDSVLQRRRPASTPGGGVVRPSQVQTQYEMATFFHHLEPPAYFSRDQQDHVNYRPRNLKNLDMSMWLTRPCVIVIAHLSDQQTPTPITIDGQTVPSRGDVIVRWVYPLPGNPRPPTNPAE
ncbi:MAG: hypothetical protein KAS72_11950 [Phycisphaerales bacterium]|nr:hypothetical protein [Phycisphaerales bacterium]